MEWKDIESAPKLVWKRVDTGELIDGPVPFMPPTRVVWAIQTASGLVETPPPPDKEG